jgi:hypothetical protein
LNRSNSALIVAPPAAFEIAGYIVPLPSLQQNPSLEQSFLSRECRFRITP